MKIVLVRSVYSNEIFAMAAAAKKRKLSPDYEENEGQSVIPKRTELLDLVDDCIELICAWLPLEDLCSFSLTCKGIHKAANRQFFRQYKNHRMEIFNTLSGPQVKTGEPYAKCFTSNIRNIRITSDNSSLRPVPLFRFLRIECCKNLSELEFNSMDLVPWQQCRERKLAQLENVTTVSFINCAVNDIYDGFLRYCKHLQHLVVKEKALVELNRDWMSRKYPNLKSLVYYGQKNCSVSHLMEFLHLNQHIKRFGCSKIRILDDIVSLNITLDYLLLRIEDPVDLYTCFGTLIWLCGQGRVRRLKLQFGCHFYYSVEIVETMKAVDIFGSTFDALSFTNNEHAFGSYHPVMNHRLKHIKSLSFDATHLMSQPNFSRLVFCVPNLEEIHLGQLIDNFRICFGVIVEKLKNLRTIAIHRIGADVITKNNIAQLDQLRKQQPDACPVIIHLPFEIIKSVKFRIPDDSMITVKPISSLEHDIFSN